MSSRPRQRKGKKTRAKQDLPRNEQRDVARLADNLASRVFITMRVLTTSSTVSTSGAGFIATANFNASSVTGANDWSNISARYKEYRVKAMRLRWWPLVTVAQCATSTYTVVPAPGPIVAAVTHNNVGYTNFAARCSGTEVRVFDPCEKVEYSVDNRAFPDAKLWTATSNTIPAEQSFGIEISDPGSAPASAFSTVYYRMILQYVVEFRLPE